MKIAIDRKSTYDDVIHMTQGFITGTEFKGHAPFASNPEVVFCSLGELFRDIPSNLRKRRCAFSESVFNYENQALIFKNHFLNHDFEIIPAFKLSKSKKFIKERNHFKTFGGFVTGDLPLANYIPHLRDSAELLIVAEPKPVEPVEHRFFISENKVVGYGQYSLHTKNVAADPLAIEYVELLLKSYLLDTGLQNLGRYVLDVVKSNEVYKVVEINCFHTSNFYNADPSSIFDECLFLIANQLI